MRIAVVSGKGGAGKTSFSVVLASFFQEEKGSVVRYLDCDCDAPNSHLFLDISYKGSSFHFIECPSIDTELCNYCGKCREICRFGAITVFNKVAMTFNELCHGCGGCFKVCDANAIRVDKRLIGEVRWGISSAIDSLFFVEGRLRIGEAMSPPLIKEVLNSKWGESEADVHIIDAPPGTSCPVISVIKEADYVLLIGEDSPFGVHDVNILITVLKDLQIPFGVIANKVRGRKGASFIMPLCNDNDVKLIGSIPFSKAFAGSYAGASDIRKAFYSIDNAKEVIWKTIEAVFTR